MEAKENCQFCLDNATGDADMHGLVYWAERVEKLRCLVDSRILSEISWREDSRTGFSQTSLPVTVGIKLNQNIKDYEQKDYINGLHT